MDVLNQHIRIIKITPGKRNSLKPWMDDDTLVSIRRKHAAIMRKDYFPTAANIEAAKMTKYKSD